MRYEIRALRPGNRRINGEVDALLEGEGLRRDKCLDYTCILLDEAYRVVATGSCFGNTLRCMAVAPKHRGEGLMSLVMSHLMEIQALRGNLHLFLYTKPAGAPMFADLGFFEIARIPDLVFMENRRSGFRDYCATLPRRPEGLKAAVVMNANPFTLGHRHLVEHAAAACDSLYLFVLSEEAGPIPAGVRKELVLRGVSHIPGVLVQDTGPYMISSATFPSYFLRDSEEVIRAQAQLDLTVFARIARELDIRLRFAGEEPHSLVTGLYNQVMAARLPEAGIDFRVIPRLRAGERFISASAVRKAIHDQELPSVRDMLPDSTYDFFSGPEGEAVVQAIRETEDVIHY